jgi:uncharacterized protein YbjT (DUF2867 family)
MTRVLITGGTGDLGSKLVARLRQEQQHMVRIMSRAARPPELDPATEWARADLATGEGIDEAVRDVGVIVHAASRPYDRLRETDVEGTRRLVEAARGAAVGHLLFISIVGVDSIPFFYYRAKLEIEGIVRDSGLPYTISRATQFHSFVDRILRELDRLPLLLFLPNGGFRAQSIDAGDYADYLIPYVGGAPAGRIPDAAGPQVMRSEEMARLWLRARRSRKRILTLHLPGATAAAFRQGYNTAPHRAVGTVTWEMWLARRYGAAQRALRPDG